MIPPGMEYGALGLVAYLVIWLTTRLDKTISKNTEAIQELKKEIKKKKK